MATIIKLQRQGAPHRPFWRIVVTDSRKPKGCIALLGTYDNVNKPVTLTLDADKTNLWLSKGALPSPSAARLLAQKGLHPRTAGSATKA